MDIIFADRLNEYIQHNCPNITKIIIGYTGIFVKYIDDRGTDRFKAVPYDFIKNNL